MHQNLTDCVNNLHYEKFQDGTVKCIEDEIPFEVPKGWAWARLASICSLISDIDHKMPKAVDNGVLFLSAKDLLNDGTINFTDDVKMISEDDFLRLSRKALPQKDDIIYSRIGACLGKARVVTKDIRFLVSYSCCTIRPVIIDSAFLASILDGNFVLDQAKEGTQSVGVPDLGMASIKQFLIPIPPLVEQQRIDKCLQYTLDIIQQISNERNDLSRMVAQIKSKILDLAIRGKLVLQDPNDEPASVLLERIRAEKEELIKQGKIKRDKKESVIFKGEDNSYYGIHLPTSWSWASLREIAFSISDGSHNPPSDKGFGIPLLSAANVNNNSILIKEVSRWITNEEWEIENQRTHIELGDVLLTIVGSIGRSAVVHTDRHFALQRSVAVIKPCLVNPLYLMNVFQAPQIQKWLNDNSKGTAQKGIYLNALSIMVIPIPPLAEQERIVEQISTAYKQLDFISNALL